ncbi:carbohydrate sulfotransferase 10-like [Panulirus ornatus]|uniref:carbohydrate sulfotransferase 10-like n=1 Tax=Panulirus ornatus TaxID=150431 RepID=UPI003A864736
MTMSRLRELTSRMLTRRLKIVLILSAFTIFVCSRFSESERLREYKQRVESRVKALVENARLPTRSDVQELFLAMGDRELLQEVAWHETSPRILPAVRYDSTKIEKNLSSSPPSADWQRRIPTSTTSSKEVMFPSVRNCTRSSRQEEGRTHETADVYPCKSWRHPDPSDSNWPVALAPTNGKVLKRLKIHHEDPKVEELMTEQMAVQQERLARLTDVCLKHPELTSVRQHITFVWDTTRTPPVIYCPVYKVASTTWMAYFLRLKHINDANPALEKYSAKAREKLKYMPNFGGGHRRVFEEYREPHQSQQKNRVFKKALRFLVVRHPFTRLLSAYRDKIERPDPRPFQPYFEHLQRAIVLRYRPADSHVTRATPTFPEFVDFVIDSTKSLKTAQDWIENVVCWLPYWVQCGVCASDYQMVLKLETMTRDEQFLAQVADLKEIQDVHEWRNQGDAEGSSATVLPHYFKNLTQRQVRLLYQRYKLDFDLFGYSVDEYLKFAGRQ